MKITITINTSEPVYPLRRAFVALDDWIDLAVKTVTHEDEEANRYPATIFGRYSGVAPAVTTIEATIEQDGVIQEKFLW